MNAGGSKKIAIPETVVSSETAKRNILRKGRGADKVKTKHVQGVDDGSTYDDVMDPGDPCYDLQEQDDNYSLVSGDADQAMLSSSPGQGGGGSSWGSRGSGGAQAGDRPVGGGSGDGGGQPDAASVGAGGAAALARGARASEHAERKRSLEAIELGQEGERARGRRARVQNADVRVGEDGEAGRPPKVKMT